MSSYQTVNYLAYRVAISTSAARAYSREARTLAEEASRLEIGGGSDHYGLLVPEIQTQATRAEAAATRAEEAIDRCWAIAREDARGPVIRISNGRHLLFAEDDSTRAAVAENFKQAQWGRAEAHLALDVVKALGAVVAGLGQPSRQGQV
jgi:sulfite reductase beta subunit-like hemoprotein